MGTQNIHIGNLQLRLPRSVAGSARQIAQGLGREILRSLAESPSAGRGTIRIDEMSAGKITVGSRTQSLQTQTADHVAAGIRKQISEERT
jgi:hypothetical protein